MHDEQLVFGVAQNLIEETEAGGAFRLQHLLLAHAGIDHQSHGQRKVGLPGKIADGLRTAVFGEGEIVLRQITDDLILPGAYGGEDVDHFDADAEGGFILGLSAGERAGAG